MATNGRVSQDTGRDGQDGEGSDLVAVELWRLPTHFFSLDEEAQWKAMEEITVTPKKLSKPRSPCSMTLGEHSLAILYFLVILGLPLCIFGGTVVLLVLRSPRLKWWLPGVVALALHPLSPNWALYRRNRIGVILAKYFTATFLIPRGHPEFKRVLTRGIEETPVKGPMLPLACPHGVLNFGAIIWVYFSRWIVGLDQYSAGAPVVQRVPGLRYLAASIGVVPADRKSMKKALQEPVKTTGKDGQTLRPKDPRRGGMLGVIPDGIAGIFRSKPGLDVLFIGKKRGLMRICLEEGALVMGAWFAGTTDQFWILTDPFGLLEMVSRKMQVALFLFVGRFGLPIPFRVPVTLCPYLVRAEKKAAPSDEDVQQLHTQVYSGLSQRFEELKHFAGYPERHLSVQ